MKRHLAGRTGPVSSSRLHNTTDDHRERDVEGRGCFTQFTRHITRHVTPAEWGRTPKLCDRLIDQLRDNPDALKDFQSSLNRGQPEAKYTSSPPYASPAIPASWPGGTRFRIHQLPCALCSNVCREPSQRIPGKLPHHFAMSLVC